MPSSSASSPARAPRKVKPPRVLYLGDRGTAVNYLLGVCEWAGFPCQHVAHDEAPPERLQQGQSDWDVVILSDYPARQLGPQADSALAGLVSEGRAGLIMLGGWESFTGKGGDYRDTAVSSLLPVRLSSADDRRNVCGGLLLWPNVSAHPLLDGISFRRPPAVMGYNHVTPRTTAQVVLRAVEIKVKGPGKNPVTLVGASKPMLVTGAPGGPRTLAFCTDLAPHWCGGMVDWGRGRVRTGAVEVGDLYLEFVSRMIRWAAGRLEP